MVGVVEVETAGAEGEVDGGDDAEGERVDRLSAGILVRAILALAGSERAAQYAFKE